MSSGGLPKCGVRSRLPDRYKKNLLSTPFTQTIRLMVRSFYIELKKWPRLVCSMFIPKVIGVRFARVRGGVLELTRRSQVWVATIFRCFCYGLLRVVVIFHFFLCDPRLHPWPGRMGMVAQPPTGLSGGWVKHFSEISKPCPVMQASARP